LSPELFHLIERYADGELGPAETAAFEARLAGDPALTAEVERRLGARETMRSAIARSMQVETPLDLRASVLATLDQSRRPVSRRQGGDQLRPRSWWQGTRQANAFAVAASLLLVAGAVLFGIFGPRVVDRPGHGGGGDVPVTEVAETVVSEHESCAARGTCMAQDQPWRNLDAASEALSALIGHAVTAPNLDDAGYQFCCGGQSRVPGAGDRAGHLLYCRPDATGDNCSFLSIFVVPVETPYLAFDPFGRAGPLQCGIDYSLLTGATGEIHYWCDGVATWFVKPSDPTDFDLVRRLFPG